MLMAKEATNTIVCVPTSISKPLLSTSLHMWQNTIIVTADELFTSLLHISPTWTANVRYDALRRVLNTAIEQQLVNVTIKLSGLYAKLDYLTKLHNVRENDRSLSFALNAMRKHLEMKDISSENELEQWWLTDFKAVTQFVSLVYEAPLPNTLSERLRDIHFVCPPSLSTHTGKQKEPVDNFRCIVTHFDNTYIQATREDSNQEIRIAYTAPNKYVPGDRSYLTKLLAKGQMLSIVRPRTNNAGYILPEIIIVLPDFLVNVTAIANCFEEVGHTPMADIISRLRPSVSTRTMLLGNFAGQLLDEEAFHKNTPYTDSIKEFFKNNALNIATCNDIDETFHQEAKQQRTNIHNILSQSYEQQTSTKFRSNQVILEPSFFSDTLGLQGRMDFLDLSYRTIIEQKAGKCRWQPDKPADCYTGKKENHYVQLLLYRALLHYDYKRIPADNMQAFLLYSRYANGLDLAPSAPSLLFEALKIRNQLAWCQQWFAIGGLRMLETLTPEKIYPNAHGPLWQRFKRPQIMEVLDPIQAATPLERAYFTRFLEFIANEQALSKVGNRTKENSGFASVWNCSIEDKREAGNIFENMTIDVASLQGNEVRDIRFSLSKEEKNKCADLSNFRRGDIVFFYPYAKDTLPDATNTMVFRCSITSLTTEHVSVRLRNAQTSRNVFDYFNGYVWAMEHDFLDSGYNAQYRSMQAFLSAPKERRELILGQRQPLTDTTRKRMGNYGNEEFNSIVEHAMQARDLYLIIGPPGTGKTSYGMKNILTDELLHPHTNVLLLSYTNRAVDEICSKLVDIEGIDFIRMGSDYNCDPLYKSYLLSERMEQMENPNKQKVINLIERTRVFCGTTTALSASLSLLNLKQFSLAIIDEASQILEPHLIGLLSATYKGKSAIERIVMIGDEKQLPAVVQQGEDESAVTLPMLNNIGLTNCRLSLFERLLHLYAYLPNGCINKQVCHMLSRQGRMHHDIADFPSKMFYENRLQEVPLPHQIAHTPRFTTPKANKTLTESIVNTCRIAFLDCQPELNPHEPDKMNICEAELIAQLASCAYHACKDDFSPQKSIGIIVPYRNQIATIKAAIAKCGPKELANITIDTVERYQGSQRDYIIYGFTVKHKYQLAFLTSHEYRDKRTGSIIDRKLNVAMTRARKHLLLVGNAPLLTNDTTFKRLIDYTKSKGVFFDTCKDTEHKQPHI